MTTKLTIEPPVELVGKGIKPTMIAWVCQDQYGTRLFAIKPQWTGKSFTSTLMAMPVSKYDFPQLQPGTCKKVRLTIEVIDE